ncbi:phage baseplate protein [Faecalibaculum rodentium]|uniref:phage baseplate protein n=1 Tax=Faecalibaculum rodentium TaxID=1702221 RepID=UPI00248CF028|nr:hypothetical protein [Faecalibaculum rodentium]
MAEKAVSVERLKRFKTKADTVYAPKSHSHNYAGSSSAGGSANSAVKLDSNAGSTSVPAYFTGGKPTACGGKVVPTNCETITDWNAATSNGFYMASGAQNAPVANQWFFGVVISRNANYLLQRVWRFTQSTDVNHVECYERMKMNSAWGAWRNVRDRNFPVGAILITHDNVNPGTRFGGTWVAHAPGRVLVGVGTGNDGSKRVTFGTGTGGEYAHKLSVAEMPPHHHMLPHTGGDHTQSSNPFSANKPLTYQPNTEYGTNTTDTGSGSAHNNIQPWQGAYFWRRTA